MTRITDEARQLLALYDQADGPAARNAYREALRVLGWPDVETLRLRQELRAHAGRQVFMVTFVAEIQDQYDAASRDDVSFALASELNNGSDLMVIASEDDTTRFYKLTYTIEPDA